MEDAGRLAMISVSIIIPVYNAQKYMGRCLESILRQSYQNLEIICVDDCGTDNSISIIKNYQEKYRNKIKIVYSESNVGPGAARDKGMREAQGEYITFIDSDDFVTKDFIENYVLVAEKTGADIIAGGYIRNVNGKWKKYPADEFDDLFMWTNINVWSKMYRREFIVENNLYFGKMRRYEDEAFLYKLMMKNPSVTIIPFSGYVYWMNPESITQNRKQDRSDMCMEYIKHMHNFYNAVPVEDRFKMKLQYCILSGLTANLLYNGKGCGIRKMNHFYNAYLKVCQGINQKIWHNPYISLGKGKSEPIKRRYAVWAVSMLHRLKCGRMVFLFVSML